LFKITESEKEFLISNIGLEDGRMKILLKVILNYLVTNDAEFIEKHGRLDVEEVFGRHDKRTYYEYEMLKYLIKYIDIEK
jgi:hypothetical protein